MSANVATPGERMTVEQYLAWSRLLPESESYELVDGIPVAMAGDSLRHNLVKGALYRAFQDGVTRAGLPCSVFTDGVNVKVDAFTARIPDCSVQCSPLGNADSMLVEPVIVAEVTSRSSARDDTGEKLTDYFGVPGILHYLIVRPDQNVIVHHRRREDGDIRTSLIGEGRLDLDPPGLVIEAAAVLRAGLIGAEA